MNRALEVLVTSGGTISEIDDVRHIGNFSTGTTGAIIAEEFLGSEAKVHYVYCEKAPVPFKRKMTLDPNKDLSIEIERLKGVYHKYSKCKDLLLEYPIKTFEDYFQTLKCSLENNPIDVVVLAAAVSDYSAIKTNGKISSDEDELVIRLKRNPKVISLVKAWRPEVYQVGFKLLVDVSKEDLIKTAYNHLIKNNSDLVVANSLSSQDLTKTATLIITSNNELHEVKRSELARKLVEIVKEKGYN
ncbi:DNA / pantothenate metabolism flavoprotein [uncultured archaeon]|nr:DNA / pantothenate metabolism flavoprotein [uncultured archaeon]